MTERWFVGDHSDIGGRFAFESLNKRALANPPFRWIVWAAACAAGNAGKPYLLFNDRAFVKYFPILLYHGTTPQPNSDTLYDPDKFLTTDYLFQHPPSDDSKAAFSDNLSRSRPEREDRDTSLTVHNSFTRPSIWRITQALRGKGQHGNKRNLDNAILHASVKGKLDQEPRYGGNNRAKLDSLKALADEGVWGVSDTQDVTFRV